MQARPPRDRRPALRSKVSRQGEKRMIESIYNLEISQKVRNRVSAQSYLNEMIFIPELTTAVIARLSSRVYRSSRVIDRSHYKAINSRVVFTDHQELTTAVITRLSTSEVVFTEHQELTTAVIIRLSTAESCLPIINSYRPQSLQGYQQAKSCLPIIKN